jgi:CheY-like chemotaxis protein
MSLKDKRILVVDDDEVIRMQTVAALEQEGCDVEDVNSARKAFQVLVAAVFEKQPFHAVVSDIDMPIVDGIEFLKRLRAVTDFIHLPVLFYSARANDYRLMCARMGAVVVNKLGRMGRVNHGALLKHLAEWASVYDAEVAAQLAYDTRLKESRQSMVNVAGIRELIESIDWGPLKGFPVAHAQ